MSLLQYLDIFIYILEESEVVSWKGSIKKVFLKIPQISLENISAIRSLLQQRCRLEARNFIKYRIWCRCFPVTFAKSLRTSILQTSARPPLKRSSLEFLSAKFKAFTINGTGNSFSMKELVIYSLENSKTRK